MDDEVVNGEASSAGAGDASSSTFGRARFFSDGDGEVVDGEPSGDEAAGASRRRRSFTESVRFERPVIDTVNFGSIFLGNADADAPPPTAPDHPTLAEQRQRFHFDFLRHSLTASIVSFWASTAVMVFGAAVVLSSGALAVFQGGRQDLKLLAGLSGVLITIGGGVLYRRARQDGADVARQAERVEGRIDTDDRFEKTIALIERVADPKLKDQLTSTAVLNQLRLSPDPEETAKRLMSSSRQPPEDESDNQAW